MILKCLILIIQVWPKFLVNKFLELHVDNLI